jgi:2'-hydroxyisoflavone reductase
MSLSRRDFLRCTAVAGAAAGLGLSLGCGSRGGSPAAAIRTKGYRNGLADRKLKLLILGGTAFLGPHTINAARARGHEVTLFNRGKTNPELFPDLEKLRGDRDGDLGALVGRTWDAVVDTSGYVPRLVRMSAELLAPSVAQYVFISTISVYKDYSVIGMDESAPLATIADPTTEQVTPETYGALKALSEKAAEFAMPGRTTVIRPGLIVGPEDRTDRFTYWPVRVARGGEVLCPGTPEDPIQFIDVRDLAEFIVVCLEDKVIGTFNADAPAGVLTMGKLLETCREVTAADARLTWVDADFLAAQNVNAWQDMPCWVPAVGPEAGFGRVNTTKAHAAGLGQRTLDDTVRATLAWWRAEPADRRQSLRAGLAPEREAAVLAAWHAKG